MHFTIIGKDFTLTANFVPCLVWSRTTENPEQNHLWNQHPDHPCYDEGDLQKALDHFQLNKKQTSSKSFLVVHASKQVGEQSDLDRIKADCESIFKLTEVISPWETCCSVD
jgi:hypothetical protein